MAVDTSELQGLDSEKELAQNLRAMRAACRKFLDDDPWHGSPRGYASRWMLESALGELRGVFGIHIAKLAAEYGLDVEDDLAVILPHADDESDEPRGRQRPSSRKP